jgi:hypothetical protein
MLPISIYEPNWIGDDGDQLGEKKEIFGLLSVFVSLIFI